MTSIIPGLYGLDSASAWRALSKDPNKYISKFSQDKAVQSEIAYFDKKAAKLTSVDDLFKDRRAMKYLLDSFGLGDEINNLGRIKKVLTQDPTLSTSLSNQLADPRFKTMATALRLDKGLDNLQSTNGQTVLQNSYIQNEFEEALGEQDTALRQAAYFARNANTISNVYSVMGDKIMRDVVTNTFSLPAQLAVQPIETQAAVIAKRVDVTKFVTSATGTVTATQLSKAKSDHDLIGKNLTVSDTAIKQLSTFQSQLSQLATDYTNLGAITDPNGANAGLIAVQQNAVPDMVRYQQMLSSGDTAMTSVDKSLASLNALITQAQKPGANLTTLKTQFNSLVSSINAQIDNAGVTTFNGSENILMNGTADTQTTVFDQKGSSVSMNRYDATSLKNLVNNANAAFGAVTGSGDMTNILAAQSRLLQGQDVATAIHTQIKTDSTGLQTTVQANSFFAASLNTDQLLQGKQSVDDALSRNSQIVDLLGKIGALATKSKGMTPSEDRSALETQFNTYRTQIRSLIENTGTAGLDNFLNNIPDQNYEIINGKSIQVKGGIALGTSIADVLDGLSLSDASSAASLETQSYVLTNRTDEVSRTLGPSQPILNTVVSTYDPKGRLDSQILGLKAKLETVISGAKSNGLNLLDPSQTNIKLSDLSSGNTLTFRAQTGFRATALNDIDGILSQMGNGNTAIISAIDDLNENISRSRRALESDNRAATMEYGKLGATIDVLDPKNTDSTSNVYKTNAFTQKFLTRYLGLNGSSGSTSNSSSSYLTSLFGSNSSSSATASLMSLALKA